MSLNEYIKKIEDNNGTYFKIKDTSGFTNYINSLIPLFNHVLTEYFIQVKKEKNKRFYYCEIEDMNRKIDLAFSSKKLEDKLSQGNPTFNKTGSLYVGLETELYERIFSTFKYGKSRVYPVREKDLIEFKKVLYNEQDGFDSKFKEDFKRKTVKNIRNAKLRWKGKHPDITIVKKIDRVFEVLESYLRNTP